MTSSTRPVNVRKFVVAKIVLQHPYNQSSDSHRYTRSSVTFRAVTSANVMGIMISKLGEFITIGPYDELANTMSRVPAYVTPVIKRGCVTSVAIDAHPPRLY